MKAGTNLDLNLPAVPSADKNSLSVKFPHKNLVTFTCFLHTYPTLINVFNTGTLVACNEQQTLIDCLQIQRYCHVTELKLVLANEAVTNRITFIQSFN